MRGVGQTQNLIDTLPNGRCAIIVSSSKIGRMIKERIEKDRGKEFSKIVKFFIINCHSDIVKMSGYSNPVFVDHSFFLEVSEDIAREALNYAHSSNIMSLIRK